jgi:hypothetical protein
VGGRTGGVRREDCALQAVVVLLVAVVEPPCKIACPGGGGTCWIWNGGCGCGVCGSCCNGRNPPFFEDSVFLNTAALATDLPSTIEKGVVCCGGGAAGSIWIDRVFGGKVSVDVGGQTQPLFVRQLCSFRFACVVCVCVCVRVAGAGAGLRVCGFAGLWVCGCDMCARVCIGWRQLGWKVSLRCWRKPLTSFDKKPAT